MGQRWCARGRLVAVAVIAVAVLAGCTSTADISGATLAPLSSAAGSPVSTDDTTPSPDASSAAPTTTETTIAEPTTGSETTTMNAPQWPASFTAEQAAMAPDALATLRAGWDVIQLMYGDPATDHSAQLNSSVADPLRKRVTSGVSRMLANGEHKDAADRIEPTAVSAAGSGGPGSSVLFDVCVDSSQSVVRDSAGGEVRRTRPELVRALYKATVLKYDDGTWLMDSLSPADPFAAC